jgi:hypothetical protein
LSGDAAIYLWIVTSFAGLATVHVTLVLGLLARTPRWRGLVALVVPPLAPYWGFLEGLRVRGVLWVATLGSYATAMVAGLSGG